MNFILCKILFSQHNNIVINCTVKIHSPFKRRFYLNPYEIEYQTQELHHVCYIHLKLSFSLSTVLTLWRNLCHGGCVLNKVGGGFYNILLPGRREGAIYNYPCTSLLRCFYQYFSFLKYFMVSLYFLLPLPFKLKYLINKMKNQIQKSNITIRDEVE